MAHADELADRFEDYEPEPGSGKDARALRDVAVAFRRLAASAGVRALRITPAQVTAPGEHGDWRWSVRVRQLRWLISPSRLRRPVGRDGD